MSARMSLGGLFGCVLLAGIGYSAWYELMWKGDEVRRARACCANQNLVDRYIGFWEARRGYFDERTAIAIELDTAGTVVRTSAGLALKEGSREIAAAAQDDDAFQCPEAGASRFTRAVHYRFLMSPEPIPELGGRTRGTVCLVHGARGPTDDPATRHAPRP